jgi:hypothetical protein
LRYGKLALGAETATRARVAAPEYLPDAWAASNQELQDDVWLASFMACDLGHFDLETRVLEPLENPFGPKVLPM